MTDGLDQALSERFAPQHDELPMPDFADVLRRATQITTRPEARKRPSAHRLSVTLGVRRVLVAAVAVATLALAGIAIADGLGVFNGISSVQHPQTTGDEIDSATKAYVERAGCTQPNGDPCAPMISGLQFDTARHLARLPDGQNIYVIKCGEADLCTVVGPPDAQFDDHSPLSRSHPSTINTYLSDSDSADRHWITFGVALDGATSVTFIPKETADGAPTGPQVTVPVHDNFWIYEGPPGADLDNVPDPFQPLTVHFADGTSVTMPGAGTGTNCAAC